jgi:hypothetical protein
MQLKGTDARTDIEPKLSLQGHGLKRDRTPRTTDQDVGAKSRGYGYLRRWTAIGAGEHPGVAVGIGKHRPNNHRSGGIPDIEAHPRYLAGISLIRLTRRTVKNAIDVTIRRGCARADAVDNANVRAAIAATAAELRSIWLSLRWAAPRDCRPH